MNNTPVAEDGSLSSTRILDAAREHIRHFGAAKTNVVDIAKLLGTSHTTIYRHFRSKAEVFHALVLTAMEDEEVLAQGFCDGGEPASERLTGLVLALHRRKRERFVNDAEMYQLYRRVLDERPEIVQNYADAITRLVGLVLEQGVQNGEFLIADIRAAAGVVRDAVTVFVHPAHVEAAFKAGIEMEPRLKQVMATLITAFGRGL